MYTDSSSRLLNPYCQKYFLLLSECDKTKEMENDPDRCESPVSTPRRMEHVVWISQQGCSFPSQTASTGASVLISHSPSVDVGSPLEFLKSLSPGPVPALLMLALHSNPSKQNRSFQQKWFEQFPWLHYNGAIKRLLTTRSIFRNLVAIFTN